MSFGFKYSKGSFTIDGNGHVQTVDGSEKVKRDVYKIMVTNLIGGYGCEIQSLIGKKLKPASVDLNIKKYLKEVLIRLIKIQMSNPYLSDDETINNASMEVWRDPEEPGLVNYKVDLELKSGAIVDDVPGQTLKIGY